jgi:hypothetical protein
MDSILAISDTMRICVDPRLNAKEIQMQRGTKYSLTLGAVPFVTLVFMLPFVNRIEPIVLGLPFLLFWILTWVMLTPFILLAAYLLEKKHNLPEEED